MIDCPLGVPGLSIPIGLASDSMPISIMLYGRPGASLGCFDLARPGQWTQVLLSGFGFM